MTSQSSRSPNRAPSSALWSSLALAVVLCAPVSGRAQQADSTSHPDAAAAHPDSVIRPGTHTVKTGDTLWDLARLYLGDPFLWPEIYRVNTDVVEDPHWIYPGEVLRLPGGAGGEPTVAVVAARAAQPGEPETLDTAITEVEVESSGPTLFHRQPNHRVTGSTLNSSMDLERAPAVRTGEYYAAPFILTDADRNRSGSLIGSTEISGIASTSDRQGFQHEERVYMRTARRTIPLVGDDFLVYRLGPSLDGIGQLAIPTGIVRVEVPDHGDAPIVRVTQQFGSVERGQYTMPLERFVSPPGADRTPIELGPAPRIAWVEDDRSLASLQSYVLVRIQPSDGVKLGDEFQIYRERVKTDAGDYLPAEPIAFAHVVKISSDAATLIVVGQRHPAIQVGTRAQLVARMP